MSDARKILRAALGPALACVIAFLAGGVFIAAIGKDPLEVYGVFFSQTFGSWYGIGQVMFKATPLIFTGLSAAIGFRAGLFNIGADGQLAVGALATAAIGVFFPALPSWLLVPLCIAGGMGAGAFWGAVPGFLKARFGAHEVINTIMMNFIAAALISYIVNTFFSVPATVHTPPIASGAELPRLDEVSDVFKASPVNFSIVLALLACLFFHFLLTKTTAGYRLRAIGLNSRAAAAAGIDVGRNILGAMSLAGAFAGLVGTNLVLGYKHYYELGFAEGIGFIGIAVALLGRNHPAGIVLSALFFGVLEYGGLTINGLVPKELVNILQAIVILLVIIFAYVLGKQKLFQGTAA